MDLFASLQDISPWWWVAFAVALGAVEMLTFTYFLIWLSLAAFGVAAAMTVAPGMSGGAQLGIFAALSVVLTIVGRIWQMNRKAVESDLPGLNRRSEKVIGRTGKALADFENGEGTVVVDGIRWRARLATGSARAGQVLSVIDADGMTLICEPVV
jgi:membrane protein implicated in regulation of membrane protease activity